MNYDNPSKRFYRDWCVTKGKKYRNIIDLPGDQALSLKHLKVNDCLTSSSKITIIEREAQILSRIKKSCKRLDLFNVSYSHGQVEDCRLDGSYDWVNLDTCSSFSFEIGTWLSQIEFATGGELNLWLTSYRSNQKVLETLRHAFSDKAHRNALLALKDKCWHDTLKGLLDGVPQNKKAEALLTFGGIAFSLNKYDFEVHPIRIYRHHINRMYVFRFTNFAKRKTPTLSLDEIKTNIDWEPSIRYASNKKPVVTESTHITDLFVRVASGCVNQQAYLTNRVRQKLQENKLEGKSVTMTLAGWKSRITKMILDVATQKKCFSLIERYKSKS